MEGYVKMKYQRNFKKIIYGFIEVEADNVEDAQKKLDEGQENEYDNKSEYEFEEWETQLLRLFS